jgi:hypothetical protein
MSDTFLEETSIGHNGLKVRIEVQKIPIRFDFDTGAGNDTAV